MKKIIIFCWLSIFIINLYPKAYAVSPDKIFQKAEGYYAVLYFCDLERGTVILKNVTAAGEISGTPIVTRKDYLEVPVSSGGVHIRTGERIDKTVANAEYLDKKVYVILAQNAIGARCVFIRIL